MTTITLDLPQDIYRRAQRTAKATQRPVEQIVVEWIQPPAEENRSDVQPIVAEMEKLTIDELLQIAQATLPTSEAARLQTLLAAQQQRTLTPSERQEAERLVAQEDLTTLRKAKALFLRWSLVVDLYLDQQISLSKAAELLDMPTLELRARFAQLGIPLRSGPADLAEAKAEVEALRHWSAQAAEQPER